MKMNIAFPMGKTNVWHSPDITLLGKASFYTPYVRKGKTGKKRDIPFSAVLLNIGLCVVWTVLALSYAGEMFVICQSCYK